MYTLHEINTPDDLSCAGPASGIPPISTADFAAHAPDAHWVLLDEASRIHGRVSLWWRYTPSYPGERLGLVGHYAANDVESGQASLKHACEQLATRGCTLAVGPMDGNTWRRYRLLTERGTEPPFFLEPDNPDDWPEHFGRAGFTALAGYTSALNSDLAQKDPRVSEVATRLASTGIEVRSAASDLERELPHIYEVSRISFQRNFLYTPVEEREFLAQYRKILPYVRRELVLLAEQAGQVIGFLFALPDHLQAERGQPCDTMIIKTVAVLPQRSAAGLGRLLVARVQEIAHELGYRRAIHALMHESNNSRNISGRYAVTMRRYTLFARRLAP